MTEPAVTDKPTRRTGRRAHWTAALVLAPTAAAAFGATMSWATQTHPTNAPAGGSAATAPAHPAMPDTVPTTSALSRRLERELAVKQTQRVKLAAQLQVIRTNLDRLKAAEHRARVAAAAAGSQVSVPAYGANSGGYVAPAAPVQAAPVQAAPVQAAPVQAPAPPPVHAGTGASG